MWGLSHGLKELSLYNKKSPKAILGKYTGKTLGLLRIRCLPRKSSGEISWYLPDSSPG